MYRAVALAGIRTGVQLDDQDALAELARRLKIELVNDRVLLDGEDVSAAIRTNEVTAAVRHSADNHRVRKLLVEMQREIGAATDIVTEGRDQGTLVFPKAECKIFLTASPEERAKRRVEDFAAQGESVAIDEVLAQQNLRDQQDEARQFGRLVRADDAIEVDTDGMTIEQVVDRIIELAKARMT